MEKTKSVVGIGCGIFEKEILFLKQQGRLTIPFVFLNSTLHMHPEQLREMLTEQIEQAMQRFEYIILVYGDCHPYMSDQYDSKRVFRVNGINCCEIALGTERYRRLRSEGAFFVFAEWANKWKEIFVKEIGLNERNAPIFMNGMHKSIVFLNVGISEVPMEQLNEMSNYFKLPVQIEPISLDFLVESIQKTYEGIRG